jgi:hypothetical protein
MDSTTKNVRHFFQKNAAQAHLNSAPDTAQEKKMDPYFSFLRLTQDVFFGWPHLDRFRLVCFVCGVCSLTERRRSEPLHKRLRSSIQISYTPAALRQIHVYMTL